jgi:putative peptidoglycan lipid II flippase
MLVVFAPQVVLYGVAVVCSGTLQAHRRFLAPAFAPLVSSLVVIAAYLVFAGLHSGMAVGTVGRAGALVLSAGTTLGVLALTATVAVPTLRLRLGLRPALRFPAGVAVAARRLAVAGTAGLLAQQAALLVALRLASAQAGAQTLFVQATAVFLVPWAVLAVPVATASFPELSTAVAHPAGNAAGFERILSRALRTVLVGALVAAGLLVATAAPVARLVVDVRAGMSASGVSDLREAIVAFAPGLPGFAVVAVAMRALYARGATRRAGAAVVTGWVTVIFADVALVAAFPTVPAATLLGAGNSAGMTVAAALLVGALLSAGVPGAFDRAGRALATGGLAGTAAGMTGMAVTAWTSDANAGVSVVTAGGAALAAAAVTVGLADRAVLPALVRDVVR